MVSSPDTCKVNPLEYMKCLLAGSSNKKLQYLSDSSENIKDLLCVIDALGYLSPASLERPDPDKYVVKPRRFITVDPAPVPVAGSSLVPTDAIALTLGAPIGQVLVIDEVFITPVNLCAMEHGDVRYTKTVGASPNMCPSFGQSQIKPTLNVIEHVILLPGMCFEVHLMNYSQFCSASFVVEYKAWLAC